MIGFDLSGGPGLYVVASADADARYRAVRAIVGAAEAELRAASAAEPVLVSLIGVGEAHVAEMAVMPAVRNCYIFADTSVASAIEAEAVAEVEALFRRHGIGYPGKAQHGVLRGVLIVDGGA
jgi:hypothetical protein